MFVDQLTAEKMSIERRIASLHTIPYTGSREELEKEIKTILDLDRDECADLMVAERNLSDISRRRYEAERRRDQIQHGIAQLSIFEDVC